MSGRYAIGSLSTKSKALVKTADKEMRTGATGTRLSALQTAARKLARAAVREARYDSSYELREDRGVKKKMDGLIDDLESAKPHRGGGAVGGGEGGGAVGGGE